MGKYAVIDIENYRDSQSVVQPVVKINEQRGTPSLTEIMNHLEVRFQHERFCCNTSHDLVDHI